MHAHATLYVLPHLLGAHTESVIRSSRGPRRTMPAATSTELQGCIGMLSSFFPRLHAAEHTLPCCSFVARRLSTTSLMQLRTTLARPDSVGVRCSGCWHPDNAVRSQTPAKTCLGSAETCYGEISGYAYACCPEDRIDTRTFAVLHGAISSRVLQSSIRRPALHTREGLTIVGQSGADRLHTSLRMDESLERTSVGRPTDT